MPNRVSKLSRSPAFVGSLCATLLFTAQATIANTETPVTAAQEKKQLVDMWQPGDTGERGETGTDLFMTR